MSLTGQAPRAVGGAWLYAAFRLITRITATTVPLFVAASFVLPLPQLHTSPSLAVNSMSPAVTCSSPSLTHRNSPQLGINIAELFPFR